MGKSNTIDQQAKLNAAFQDYINTQTAALDKMTQDAEMQIAAMVSSFYKDGNWTDAAPLVKGKYEHLSTVSEWSLDNVSKIIDALKNSIFGAPAPAGSTAPPQPTDLARNVAQMSEMTLLITSAAFNAIQGIMATFATSTQTSVQKDFSTKELAPGLTLFLCVIDNQYHRSDFLTNNTILQTGYLFDVRFSIQQAGSIANFNQVQSLIAEQGASQQLLAKFDQALGALDVTADNFDAKSAQYNESMGKLNAQISDLQKGIQSLIQKRNSALIQKRAYALKKTYSASSGNYSSLLNDEEMATIHKLGIGLAVKVIATSTATMIPLAAVTYLTKSLIDKFPQDTKPKSITVSAIPPQVVVVYEDTKVVLALTGKDRYESALDDALNNATREEPDLKDIAWTLTETHLTSSY
jgi:hypothetical protein